MRAARPVLLLALVVMAWMGGRAALPDQREVLGGAILVVLGGVLAIAWLRRNRPRGAEPGTGE